MLQKRRNLILMLCRNFSLVKEENSCNKGGRDFFRTSTNLVDLTKNTKKRKLRLKLRFMSRPYALEFLLHTTLDRTYGGLLLPDLTNLVLEYVPPPCVSCGESRKLYPCLGYQLCGTRRADLTWCASMLVQEMYQKM